MAKYLIESPHTEEECTKALDETLAYQRKHLCLMMPYRGARLRGFKRIAIN